MLKHVWSILCQRSVIDNQTNNLSLIDVLENLRVSYPLLKTQNKNLINVPLNYELVNLWTKDTRKKEKAEIRILMVDPDNKVRHKVDKVIEIEKDKRNLREINKIQGISVTKDGIYKFQIKVKKGGKYFLVAEIPINIKIVIKEKV